MLLLPAFDISIIIYSIFFITPLAFGNDNVSLIQTFKLYKFAKLFIEKQVLVKSNQIHGFVTVLSMKRLPPKIGE